MTTKADLQKQLDKAYEVRDTANTRVNANRLELRQVKSELSGKEASLIHQARNVSDLEGQIRGIKYVLESFDRLTLGRDKRESHTFHRGEKD